MDDLKQHDEYTNKVLVPKFGQDLAWHALTVLS